MAIRLPQNACTYSSRSSSQHLCRWILVILACAPITWFCDSARAMGEELGTPASAPGAPTKPAEIVFPVSLDSSLDSKNRGAGDKVEAKTPGPIQLSDGTFIPRDAKVSGHITESKARSKGDPESSLAIVFDSVSLPGGKVLNIKGYLRAVAPDPDAGQSGSGVDYGSSLSRTLEHAGTSETSSTVVPILNQQSTGVQGIKNLTLGDDGVLRSPGKSVKVGHGLQMMLRAQVVSTD
jgi:hypothetical protein